MRACREDMRRSATFTRRHRRPPTSSASTSVASARPSTTSSASPKESKSGDASGREPWNARMRASPAPARSAGFVAVRTSVVNLGRLSQRGVTMTRARVTDRFRDLRGRYAEESVLEVEELIGAEVAVPHLEHLPVTCHAARAVEIEAPIRVLVLDHDHGASFRDAPQSVRVVRIARPLHQLRPVVASAVPDREALAAVPVANPPPGHARVTFEVPELVVSAVAGELLHGCTVLRAPAFHIHAVAGSRARRERTVVAPGGGPEH